MKLASLGGNSRTVVVLIRKDKDIDPWKLDNPERNAFAVAENVEFLELKSPSDAGAGTHAAELTQGRRRRRRWENHFANAARRLILLLGDLGSTRGSKVRISPGRCRCPQRQRRGGQKTVVRESRSRSGCAGICRRIGKCELQYDVVEEKFSTPETASTGSGRFSSRVGSHIFFFFFFFWSCLGGTLCGFGGREDAGVARERCSDNDE